VIDGERQILLLGAGGNTGNHDFLEAIHVLPECEVDGLRSRRDRDGARLRHPPERSGSKLHRLAVYARRGNDDRIRALRVGRHRDPKLCDEHIGALERLAELRIHLASEHGILRFGCSSKQRYEHQRLPGGRDDTSTGHVDHLTRVLVMGEHCW